LHSKQKTMKNSKVATGTHYKFLKTTKLYCKQNITPTSRQFMKGLD